MQKRIKENKLLLLLLVVILAFSMTVGCSGQESGGDEPDGDGEAATTETSSGGNDQEEPFTYSLADAESTPLRGVDPGSITRASVTPVELNGRALKVGFSQMEVNNNWRITNNESIMNEAAKRGIELLYRDAQSSIEKQNRDVIDLLNQGVDYLIIAPYEFEGLAPALAEAKQRGVPVILSDRLAAGTPGVDYVTGVLGDFIDTGYKAGVSLREGFGDMEINVVEITGTAGSSVARDLSEGFKMWIEDDGNVNHIAIADGNFGRAESLKAMENIIQAYGGQFNAVFGHVDDAAIASIQALKAAGYTPGQDAAAGDILIASMCGYKDAFDAIIAGDQWNTVECSSRFGPILFDIIERLQSGGDVATRIVMPCKVYDISNVRDLYHEAL